MRPVPSPLNPPPVLPADLDEIVLSALARHRAPGCAVAVAYGGRHWTGAYGLARTEPAMPFLPETRIPVASMTKPFTATAVLALVERGLVDLDAPVVAYLPGFRVADPAATAAVTVRHLLTHLSGWLGDEPGLVGGRGEGALAEQVAAFATLPQILPPGTAFSYSNTGLDVAGRLVEVVSGRGYEAFVEEEILAPLGMTDSAFFAERVISAPAAAGHLRDGDGGVRPVQEAWLLPRGVNPSGGLISTAGDQLRWLCWWLGELDVGGPLSPGTRKTMIADPVPVRAGAGTGLGWHLDDLPRGPAQVSAVYHEGSLEGTATVCRFVPEAGLAVVVLTNVDDGQLVHREISDRLLAELAGIGRPERPVDRTPRQEDLAGYAGRYTTPDADVEVTAAPGGLRLRVHLGRPLEMSAGRVEGDDFTLIDGTWQGEPVTFLRTSDGDLLGLRIAGRVFPRTGGAA
ncbi:serine hydrolase domain-containing protein [Nonomuraea typhae]|uniref:serine hydrolase domain-containing protein n=1 Tax=Nonomuraea typhae TaxID=2603600 RepID=UPI0012FBDA5B|nr:serine hydrolase domain-containing protein [Nonomuraea typhae]